MDQAFLQTRIDKAKEQIVAIEEAYLAIATGAISSYTLNTGQSQTTVTKSNLSTLDTLIDSLMNRVAVLEARRNGTGVSVGRGYW